MIVRSIATATLMAGVMFTTAPQAQGINLPPDVYGALTEIWQAASYNCQAGVGEACNTATVVENYANQLSAAFYWCQMNDPNACQFYQMGVQEVGMAYQQYQQTMMSSGFPRTPQQHQQIMQQNQQIFDGYQQTYRNQQDSLDRSHQQFIQSIRGE